MKKLVIIVATVFLSMATVAAWAETGNFNVGPFERGNPFLSSDLKGQVVTGTSKIPEDATVKIIGYTDATGPPDFNKKLAQWRAQEVAEEIRGIDPEVNVIEVTGKPFQGKSGEVNYRMVKVVFSEKASVSGSASTPKKLQSDNKKASQSPEVLSRSVQKHTDRISRQIKELESKLDKLRQESTWTGKQLSSMEEQIKKDIRTLIQETNQKDQDRLKEIQATLKQIKQERKQEDSSGFWTLLTVMMIIGLLLLLFLAVAGYLVFKKKMERETDSIKQEIRGGFFDVMMDVRGKKDQIFQDIKERTTEVKTFIDSSLGERAEQIEQRIEESDTKTKDLSRELNAKLDELKSIVLTPQEKQTLREEWVKVNSHQVKVQVTSDRVFLPFISSHGEQMYRSSWRDVKKALKGSLKKESFAGQVEQLKREGKIIENKEDSHE